MGNFQVEIGEQEYHLKNVGALNLEPLICNKDDRALKRTYYYDFTLTQFDAITVLLRLKELGFRIESQGLSEMIKNLEYVLEGLQQLVNKIELRVWKNYKRFDEIRKMLGEPKIGKSSLVIYEITKEQAGEIAEKFGQLDIWEADNGTQR